MPVDRDLAAALKTAKAKTMDSASNFVLVEKKPGEGTLIVSKSTIPAGAITEAQRALGGGKIFKGQCAGDAQTGELVFETTADSPDPRTLKAVISRDAGLSLKVAVRKTSLVKKMVDAFVADSKKRLAAIEKSDTYKLLLSLGGPAAADLKKKVETVKKAILADDPGTAEVLLDELEKLLASPTI